MAVFSGFWILSLALVEMAAPQWKSRISLKERRLDSIFLLQKIEKLCDSVGIIQN